MYLNHQIRLEGKKFDYFPVLARFFPQLSEAGLGMLMRKLYWGQV